MSNSTRRLKQRATAKATRKAKPVNILFIGQAQPSNIEPLTRDVQFTYINFQNAFAFLELQKPDAVLVSVNLENDFGCFLEELKAYGLREIVPVVLYSTSFYRLGQNIALRFGFDDYYFGNLVRDFRTQLRFIKNRKHYQTKRQGSFIRIKRWHRINVNLMKRMMDMAVSSAILVALTPVLLIIAALIKLESRGPVFYISKRAGVGYKVFNFYKFRTMYAGADQEIADLLKGNQYGESVFFKMKNDPRITRLGSFLRKTSLDELPQLINVLKGDMSLVGNRPLPLYEAKCLTKDTVAGRFLAPAGITGLWQIMKRGKSEMSESERIDLDLSYARQHSFWFDLKIILGTFPALMQKESV